MNGIGVDRLGWQGRGRKLQDIGLSMFKREGQGSLKDAFLAPLGKAAQAGQLRKGLNLVLETERLIAL